MYNLNPTTKIYDADVEDYLRISQAGGYYLSTDYKGYISGQFFTPNGQLHADTFDSETGTFLFSSLEGRSRPPLSGDEIEIAYWNEYGDMLEAMEDYDDTNNS